MKKTLSFLFVISLLLCTPQKVCANWCDSLYVSNSNPQFMALCGLGVVLGLGGIYTLTQSDSWFKKIIIGVPCTLGGIALVLTSKEIVREFSKASMRHNMRC